MDLLGLRVFLVCARLQNFTRAAVELSYAQSSVTGQIKGLERTLGVPLFDRVGRGVVLTAAGERLVDHAEQILGMVDRAQEAVSFAGTHPTGELTISATETLSTYTLPEILRRYQARWPDVRLYLRPHDPRGLVQRVVDGEAAMAITLDRPIVHPDLQVEHLREEPVLLLAPPDHPLCGRARVRASDLAGQRFLLSELDASYGGLFLDRLAADGVRPTAPMEFASVAAIKQCVRSHMGLTVLPRFACREEVDAGHLTPLAFQCTPAQVQLLRHRHRWVPPAAQALMDLTRELAGVDTAGP